MDGDTVRRVRKKQKTAHNLEVEEELPPRVDAAEEEEPVEEAGDEGEEDERRESRPSEVAWTTSRLAKRWGPFRCALCRRIPQCMLTADVASPLTCRPRNSQEEKDTLDGAIRGYATQHGLSPTRLDWLFHTRTRSAADKERTRRVWLELAEATPHRSPKQVWAAVTRRLHEAKGQGKWSSEEADQLRGLVQQHGTAWTEIGAVLGRAPEECKDKCVAGWGLRAIGMRVCSSVINLTSSPDSHRWRVVKHGSALKLGPWSEEELAQLSELVARFEAQQPAPKSGKAVRGDLLA